MTAACAVGTPEKLLRSRGGRGARWCPDTCSRVRDDEGREGKRKGQGANAHLALVGVRSGRVPQGAGPRPPVPDAIGAVEGGRGPRLLLAPRLCSSCGGHTTTKGAELGIQLPGDKEHPAAGAVLVLASRAQFPACLDHA